MKTKLELRPFQLALPGGDETGYLCINVPMEWDDEVKEWLMTEEAERMVENAQAKHLGLLLPDQLLEFRKRLGYTQREMGSLFAVGDKTWTRWETGRNRPTESSSLIIRAVLEGEIPLSYLQKLAGLPVQEPPGAVRLPLPVPPRNILALSSAFTPADLQKVVRHDEDLATAA